MRIRRRAVPSALVLLAVAAAAAMAAPAPPTVPLRVAPVAAERAVDVTPEGATRPVLRLILPGAGALAVAERVTHDPFGSARGLLLGSPENGLGVALRPDFLTLVPRLEGADRAVHQAFRFELPRPFLFLRSAPQAGWRGRVERAGAAEDVAPWMTVVRLPEGYLLLGLLHAERSVARFDFDARGGALVYDVPAGPREGGLEPVFVGFGRDFAPLAREYAARVRRVAGGTDAPPPGRTPSGWRTGPVFGAEVSEAAVLAGVAFARRQLAPYGLEVIELDPGYEKALGDWETNAKFPSGHRGLTDRIHAAGFRAALALDPFVVAPDAPVALEHPDWLVRTPDGRALAAEWSGGRALVLDASLPAVRAWIEALVRRATGEWGYDVVVVEHAAEALSGFFAEGAARIAIYREALAAIRRGVGPDRLVFAADAPTLPSAGLVDGVRLADLGPGGGTPERAAFDMALRFFEAGTLWAHDPGGVPVAGGTLDAARAWASVVALAGAAPFAVEDLERLAPERLAVLRAVFPAAETHLDLLDFWSAPGAPGGADAVPDPPALWAADVQRAGIDYHVVGLVNWSDAPAERTLEFSRLGLHPKQTYLVSEFWAQKPMGELAGALTVTLPPRSAQVFVIHLPLERPQVILTNRHVVAGAVEIAGEAWDGTELTARLVRPGLGRMTLDVHVPRGLKLTGVGIAGAQVERRVLAPERERISFDSDGSERALKLVFAGKAFARKKPVNVDPTEKLRKKKKAPVRRKPSRRR